MSGFAPPPNEEPRISEYERGVRDAEQRIIEWLRSDRVSISDIPDNEKCRHDRYSWDGCEECLVRCIAADIERGEHRKHEANNE